MLISGLFQLLRVKAIGWEFMQRMKRKEKEMNGTTVERAKHYYIYNQLEVNLVALLLISIKLECIFLFIFQFFKIL